MTKNYGATVDIAERALYESGAFGFTCMNMYAKTCGLKHTTKEEAINCCESLNAVDRAVGYGSSWSYYHLDRNGYI